MSTEGNAAVDGGGQPQPTQVSPPQPAQPTLPEGQVAVSRDELARLQRLEQRALGSTQLADAAVSAGFKTPEDIKRTQDLLNKARSRGLDLESLLSDASPAQLSQQQQQQVDPDELVERLMGSVDEKLAKREYEAASRTELALINNAVSGLAGSSASEEDKVLAEAIVNRLVSKSTKVYGSDHIMAGQIVPLSADDMAKVEAEAKKLWKSVRGSTVASVAKGTVLNEAREGGAGPSSPSNPNERKQPTREEMLARAREHLAKLQPRPTSQA